MIPTSHTHAPSRGAPASVLPPVRGFGEPAAARAEARPAPPEPFIAPPFAYAAPAPGHAAPVQRSGSGTDDMMRHLQGGDSDDEEEDGPAAPAARPRDVGPAPAAVTAAERRATAAAAPPPVLERQGPSMARFGGPPPAVLHPRPAAPAARPRYVGPASAPLTDAEKRAAGGRGGALPPAAMPAAAMDASAPAAASTATGPRRGTRARRAVRDLNFVSGGDLHDSGDESGAASEPERKEDDDDYKPGSAKLPEHPGAVMVGSRVVSTAGGVTTSSYARLDGAQHREVRSAVGDGFQTVTTTTGAPHVPGTRQNLGPVANLPRVSVPAALTPGQKALGQTARAHDTPSSLGARAGRIGGQEYGNAHATSHDYNAATEEREAPIRGRLRRGQLVNYRTDTTTERVASPGGSIRHLDEITGVAKATFHERQDTYAAMPSSPKHVSRALIARASSPTKDMIEQALRTHYAAQRVIRQAREVTSPGGTPIGSFDQGMDHLMGLPRGVYSPRSQVLHARAAGLPFPAAMPPLVLPAAALAPHPPPAAAGLAFPAAPLAPAGPAAAAPSRKRKQDESDDEDEAGKPAKAEKPAKAGKVTKAGAPGQPKRR